MVVSDSSRDPALTHTPSATDSTVGTYSDRICKPLGNIVIAMVSVKEVNRVELFMNNVLKMSSEKRLYAAISAIEGIKKPIDFSLGFVVIEYNCGAVVHKQ